MRKLLFILALLALAVFLAFGTTGCSALRVLNPFDAVTGADAEWEGVKSGPVVGLTPTLAGTLDDPRAISLGNLLTVFAPEGDPLGVLMPLSLVGDPQPRWVLCTEQFLQKCKQIPINTTVHFAGRPAGVFWKPVRLTAEHFND